jgi:glutaredoxin
MNLTRHLKGKTLNLVDRLIPVKPFERSREEQVVLDRESRRMHLYFSPSCPASISVKRFCERVGLHVVEKDVERVDAFRNELVNGGGESRVPCLCIHKKSGNVWLYSPESITDYLRDRLRKMNPCHQRVSSR